MLVTNNDNQTVDTGALTNPSTLEMQQQDVYTNPNYLDDIPHTMAQIPMNVDNTQDHAQRQEFTQQCSNSMYSQEANKLTAQLFDGTKFFLMLLALISTYFFMIIGLRTLNSIQYPYC